MKSRSLIAVAFLLSLTAGVFAAAPRRPARGKPLPPADAGMAFTPDKGKFRILLAGSEAGTEDFDLAPSGNGWVAHGNAVIRVPGSGETRSSGTLRLAADGSPSQYQWNSDAPKKASGSVTFDGGTAKTSITLAGKDAYHQDFQFNTPHVAVLDNNLYDQYAILAHLYNWNTKGTQNFPVLIPQDLTPGSIAIEWVGPESSGGAQLDALRVRTADVQIDLFFDARHHLIRLEVPAAKVVVVRQ